MNSLLTIDRELARQLARACLAEGSGVLTATRGRLKRLFCVEGGLLVHGVSNVVEEQISERLLRQGHLAPERLAELRAEGERQTELKLTGHLVACGAVPRATMEAALGEQVRELVYATLDWTDGECTFARGQPDLRGEVSARVAVVPLLWDYARTHPLPLEQTRLRIGPPNACPSPTADRQGLLAALTLEPSARTLLERCDGSRTLGRLVEEATTPPEETLRVIYGLVLIGAVAPDGTVHAPAGRGEAAVSREEVLARLQRAEDADHYAMLELNPTARREEVREAYYFLARRYHPDRFGAGPLRDMLGRIEAYFTRVTDAYNTLYDPELRESYDKQREVAAPRKTDQDTKDLARQNYVRARGLIGRGRYTDAVTFLENAIKLDRNVAAYHLELGQLLAGNPRRRDDAEQHLIEATRLAPAAVDGYLALGQLYLRLERRDEAAGMFREVLRWEPGHLEATSQLEELGNPPPSGDAAGGRFRGLFKG